MRVAIVAISVAALLTLSGWTAEASPIPPKCSPADTQRHATLLSEAYKAGGPFSVRYCGPGRAVVRVGGKSFTIKGGYCTAGRVRFGLFADVANAKGIVLVMVARKRIGRTEIIDASVRLPGVTDDPPNTGTAIRAKGPKSGTFALVGSTGPRYTGSWTCG